jgi:dTDP-4-dehydrorhamnose 3,5-epimerase
MAFRFEKLEIPGTVLIEPSVFADDRGFFMETYKHSDFAAAGICGRFAQENHSRSAFSILRGLHYQRSPKAQGKLVRVVSGTVFDVAVDLEKGSSTLGKWIGVYLSAENRRMLYIPPWCAHGFCVMSEQAEVVYKTDQEYAPEAEGGIIWNDPSLGIQWPINGPTISEKDRRWPLFDQGRAQASPEGL